jgi:hypothetical protein
MPQLVRLGVLNPPLMHAALIGTRARLFLFRLPSPQEHGPECRVAGPDHSPVAGPRKPRPGLPLPLLQNQEQIVYHCESTKHNECAKKYCLK